MLLMLTDGRIARSDPIFIAVFVLSVISPYSVVQPESQVYAGQRKHSAFVVQLKSSIGEYRLTFNACRGPRLPGRISPSRIVPPSVPSLEPPCAPLRPSPLMMSASTPPSKMRAMLVA
jgi:hypothetical protein